MKKLFALFLVLMLLCSCAVSEAPEVSETSEEDEFTEEYYDRKFMDEVVTDEEKKENIFSALDDIQINTEFIKDFKKVEETAEGEKYSFTYRETEFTVIMESDSTIYSVKAGEEGTDIYLKGYESYNVEDYICPDSMKQGMKYAMDNAVEICFDDPAVFEYAGDWSYGHEGNYRYVSVTVLIGEEKEEHFISLTHYYVEEENSLYWLELLVDGEKISLPTDFEIEEIPERQKLS